MTRPTSSDALPEHDLDAGYAQLAEEFNGEAHRVERRSAFDAERAATVAEAASQDSIDEDHDWDQTVAVGID